LVSVIEKATYNRQVYQLGRENQFVKFAYVTRNILTINKIIDEKNKGFLRSIFPFMRYKKPEISTYFSEESTIWNFFQETAFQRIGYNTKETEFLNFLNSGNSTQQYLEHHCTIRSRDDTTIKLQDAYFQDPSPGEFGILGINYISGYQIDIATREE